VRRALVFVVALGVLLGACGKGSSTTSAAGSVTAPTATETETESPGGGCGTEASPIAELPAAVQGFPGLGNITVTNVEVAGPSTIISGTTGADLDAVFDGFKTAFDQAGFNVTSSEKEEDDAEVNFSGHGTTGQVALKECDEDRTNVAITVRPA
jgi:hypothetical protein